MKLFQKSFLLLIIGLPVAALLDIFHFSGALYPLSGIEFTLLYVALAGLLSPGVYSLLAALSAGLLLDSISSVPVNTLLFTGLIYSFRLVDKVFIERKSIFYPLACSVPISAALLLRHASESDFHFQSFYTLIFLLEWSMVNSLIFVIVAMLFRERGKAAVYKMN